MLVTTYEQKIESLETTLREKNLDYEDRVHIIDDLESAKREMVDTHMSSSVHSRLYYSALCMLAVIIVFFLLKLFYHLTNKFKQYIGIRNK